MGRIYTLYQIWNRGCSDDKREADPGLLRLLLGKDTAGLDESNHKVRDFLASFHNKLSECSRDPVSEMLRDCGGVYALRHEGHKRIGIPRKNGEGNDALERCVDVVRNRTGTPM